MPFLCYNYRMSDNLPEADSPPSLPEKQPLSDYSHRHGDLPAVHSDDHLITEPTPAQRERLIYLVDGALDTLEKGMESGKMSDRINSANSVLDRAGMTAKTAMLRSGDESAITPDELSQVIGGLAKMFGIKGAHKMRDVSSSASSVAKTVMENEHGHSLKPSTPPKKAEVQAELQSEADKSRPKEAKSHASGLPSSLLRSYGVNVDEKTEEEEQDA